MSKLLLVRLLISIFIVSFFLYLYTDQHNQLTRLRFRMPLVVKEIRVIQEENKRLQYEIDRFESPENLITLARRSEFNHLNQPLVKDIVNCQEGIALEFSPSEKRAHTYSSTKPTLAILR